MKTDKLKRHIKYLHKFTKDIRLWLKKENQKIKKDIMYIAYLKYVISQLVHQKKHLRLMLKRRLENGRTR